MVRFLYFDYNINLKNNIMSTTNFDEFLHGVNLDDYNEIYELANAASQGENGNYYEVTQDGDKIFIKCVYADITLALLSEAVRNAFISKLEQDYMDGMDQESFWGYKRALEKSDEEDARHGI